MGFKGWDRATLQVGGTGTVEAVAPILISASRRTDIPAFYAEWFIERLRAGAVKWVNPFSGDPQHVSLARARAVVFWTKNPRPLMPFLMEIEQRGLSYYFQYTLNDYEAEGLEPGVPPLEERIGTFQELAQTIGKARVVWRYDPLMLACGLPIDGLVDKVVRIGDRLRCHTEKLVIAFADIERYAKVRRRVRTSGKGCRELSPDEMRVFAEKLVAFTRSWNLPVATCAEAIDLSDLGIIPNKCIDDALLARLFPHDAELTRFLGPEQDRRSLRDKGQRKECGCIVSKDIGAYDTCPHLCRYCYANSSDQTVSAARARRSVASTPLT
jgi:hypothetical protein